VVADSTALTPAKELVERAEERRGQQSGRIMMYDRYLTAYFQGQSPDQTGGGAALDNYSDGRPALRAPGENAASVHGGRASPNYIKPIIKDLVSIKGQWPSLTVQPASGDEAAQKKAVLIRRGLVQQHTQSSMVKQWQRGGFFASCLGDAVIALDPRTPAEAKEHPNPFRPTGIYYNVLNPRQSFPKFRQGGGDDDLEDLFWISRITRNDCKAQYPGIRMTEQDQWVDVIHYYSRSERQTIVNKQRAHGIVHDLGFCPAEWIPNDVTLSGFGQSDIAGILDLHSEMSDLWKVYVDSIWGSVYPIYVIKDPQNTQGQLEYGPGAQFTTTGTGDVKVLAPQADAQSAQLIFHSALDNIMKQAGISPIRLEGQIDRSNVSAKSVDRQQAPQEQRLKAALELAGAGLERLNSKCLLMLSSIKEFQDEPMELYGQDKDGTYNETFSGADIGGWTRNKVKWDDMTGQTRQEASIQALQFFKEGQGDFPFSAVLEAGGFDDPTEVMERGHSEMQERMKLQQQMQPQQPPGAQGGAPPGAGPPPGAGGAGGSPPVQPPPPQQAGGNGTPAPGGEDQMPNFSPVASSPAGGGKGSPAPVPDPATELDQAVHSVALRGTAEIVARGSGWVIDITDNADASRIRFAIKPIEQALGIKVAVVLRPADKVA
jgi:hypothetical protein